MPILSMKLSGVKLGGSSVTPMGHRPCFPPVPLATSSDGDQPASRGSAPEDNVAPGNLRRMADAARQTFMRIWNHLRCALIRDTTPHEEDAYRVVYHRRRFWAELREGQREAEAARLEAERVPKQRPVV